MEQNKDFAWLKYEKCLGELEKRLKYGAAAKHQPAAGAVAVAQGDSAEEIKFLKAEAEQSQNAKDEVITLKAGLESLLKHKDSEISKLFAKCRELEDKNNILKNKVSRLSFDAAREPQSRRHSAGSSSEESGIFSWLQKPLIVIGSK